MSTETAEKTVGDATGSTATDQKITIHLTDRAPVLISEASWPILTQAVMPIYRIDPRKPDCCLIDAIKASLECPEVMISSCADDFVNGQPEYTQDCFITVLSQLHVILRRHNDGRVLLYGVRKTPQNANVNLSDSLGGELLNSDKNLPTVLKKHAKAFIDMCGGACGDALQKLVETCLAGLPPEILDDDKAVKADSGVIVLTGPRPVRISSQEWPIITEAKTLLTYLFYENEYAEGVQQTFGHERLAVRQHHDGKALVYGYLRFEGWPEQFNIFNDRGGTLVETGSDLAAAIKQVGTALHLQAETIRACVNGLPAQELE